MEALPAGLLWDVAQEAMGVAVIGIDEGQFVSWLVRARPSCDPLTVPLSHLYLVLWVQLGSEW